MHVVRAHGDENVVHPEGRVDPLADIETIETELVLADLEQAERRLERVGRQARGGDRVAIAEEAWLRAGDRGAAGRARRRAPCPLPEEAPNAARDLGSLTTKPVLFVANVDEGSEEVPAAVAEHAAAQGARAVAVSSRIESELAELEDDDAAAMRSGARRQRVGPASVSCARPSRCSTLIAFFTAGEAKPAQSWHLRRGLSAWHAGGEIHTDIQKGFVRAEVIGWRELVDAGGYARRPRARHAAPRGPRLRDGRRRRDHGQVHAVAHALAASRCGQAPIPSSLAARARRRGEVGGAVGAGAPRRSRCSVAICLKSRSSSAFSRSARAIRGRTPRAARARLAAARRPEQRLERAVRRAAARAAVLAPMPGAPGRPSEGSPRSAMKSGTCAGSMP